MVIIMAQWRFQWRMAQGQSTVTERPHLRVRDREHDGEKHEREAESLCTGHHAEIEYEDAENKIARISPKAAEKMSIAVYPCNVVRVNGRLDIRAHAAVEDGAETTQSKPECIEH